MGGFAGEAEGDEGSYCRQDDAEGDEGGNVDPVGGEHFEGDKGEDNAEAIVEQVEAVEEAGEDEVEGAQAEDGEDIGGPGDHRRAGNCEDGGDGVEGEDEVGEFDGEDDEQERGEHEAAIRKAAQAVMLEPADRA